ncbi:MAG: RidA family protein [Coriobacteriales bacterium]|jgi:2-iminobutanoate/2-iminopropanoate deaminase|nr:RidA family protein [Coriobacteriales bacterium]
MQTEIINTENAPAAIGPYVQGRRAGEFVFTSGQLPLVPATGELAGPGITEQTRQTLENLKAVLEAAGSGLDRVIKTTVFLTDMNDFAAFNAVYSEYFHAQSLPARSALACKALAKDALVEIEAIACG